MNPRHFGPTENPVAAGLVAAILDRHDAGPRASLASLAGAPGPGLAFRQRLAAQADAALAAGAENPLRVLLEAAPGGKGRDDGDGRDGWGHFPFKIFEKLQKGGENRVKNPFPKMTLQSIAIRFQIFEVVSSSGWMRSTVQWISGDSPQQETRKPRGGETIFADAEALLLERPSCATTVSLA